MSDLISRADAIEAVCDCTIEIRESCKPNGYCYEVRNLMALPSAEAVQGWRTDKPTCESQALVTLDAFGRRFIDIFYYGKPLMPNRKIKGMCWYRSDDEWGDVVYDDNDILAWMPLPEPYREEKQNG